MYDFKKILQKIDESDSKWLILISGYSCSGKTFFAEKLAKELEKFDPALFHQDDYYKNGEDMKRDKKGYRNMDEIEAFHVEEFKEDVKNLIEGQSILTPDYNVSENIRISKMNFLKSSRVIIAEGLHTILILKDICPDIKVYSIFLDTDIDVCIERRMKRDCENMDVTPEIVERYFRYVVIDHYGHYLQEMLKISDEVVNSNVDQ